MSYRPTKQMTVCVLILSAMCFTGCATVKQTADPIFEVHQASSMTLDGKLDEPAWQKATFVTLTGYVPQKPKLNQIENLVHGAFLWDDKGLYVGMEIEDEDIQANKTQKNDWIWLEDAFELFLAKRRTIDCPHLELQVNPAGVCYEELMQGSTIMSVSSIKTPDNMPRYQVATHVQGSINDSKNKDERWSVEWFIPWDQLRQKQMLVQDTQIKPGRVVCYARLANWNISIYSYFRVMRYLKPGTHNPHDVATYRPLMLMKQ
ncbi:MAG: carbohydrate-binding family 9-like protein [Phycisphaeraceae bacterium JB051]